MEEANKAVKRFDACIEFVLAAEGGYVNDKYDTGGETKYGISKRSYPKVDIKNLTLEAAREIYKRDYWDACHCSELLEPLDVVVFDTAVNMGVGRAKEFLNEPYEGGEGKFGDITPIVIEYLKLRDAKYDSIVANKPSQKKYIKGWRNRMNHLREFCGIKTVDY